MTVYIKPSFIEQQLTELGERFARKAAEQRHELDMLWLRSVTEPIGCGILGMITQVPEADWEQGDMIEF